MQLDPKTREKLTVLATLWTAFASGFLIVIVTNF